MAKKFMNGIDLQNQRGVNAADPSSATDIATKQYVDNTAAGKQWKEPVDAATTANVAIASGLVNGQVIDGVTLVTGMRVLAKAQTAGAENGIYDVPAAGAAPRSSDANSAGELKAGTTVYVIGGTANGDKEFSITSPDGAITIGTTSTTWGQTGGSGTTYTASLGVQLSGTDIRANLGTGLTLSGNQIIIDDTRQVRRYAANIGDGSTTAIAVTHSLGTRDIEVSVHDAATFEEVYPDVVKTSTSVVTLTFGVAPASNAYRVVVFG